MMFYDIIKLTAVYFVLADLLAEDALSNEITAAQ